MIFLYILLGLIALIAFLPLLPLKVRVLLDENGKLSVRVWISFVALLTHPAKETSFHPARYSPRAIAKRERRQAKQYERQQKKKAKRKQKASAHVEKKAPATLSQKINKLTDTISFVTSLLRKLQEKFLRSVHIHLHEFSIRVGSDDAAKTALLFGVISPAAAALLTALSEFTNLHLHHPDKICVAPDFESNALRARIDIRIKMRVCHLLSLGIDTLRHIILHKQPPAQHKAPAALSQKSN